MGGDVSGDIERSWHMERENWSLWALEISKPGELIRKGPIKEERTSPKGKAVLLSPPTPGPRGVSHLCTHHLSYASGLAFSSFSMSQLWFKAGRWVCTSKVSSQRKILTSVLAHTCWKTPCPSNRIIKCFLLMKSKAQDAQPSMKHYWCP